MNKLIKITLCIIMISFVAKGAEPDSIFLLPVSVKYRLNDELKGAEFKKVVIDYDNNVIVLSNRGVSRVFGDVLAKDNLYTPIADKVPIDICIQEETKYLYYLLGNKWITNAYAGVPYANLPDGKYSKIAVAKNGSVMVAGSNIATLFINGDKRNIKIPKGVLRELVCKNGKFYALISNAIYVLEADSKYNMIHSADNINTIAFGESQILIGTSNGYYGISNTDGTEILPIQTKVPVPDISVLVINKKGLWAGTQKGAFLREPSGKYRYFASMRWLNTDNVIDIASDSNGNPYLLTKSGLNKIEYKRMTLEAKAEFFQNKIRQRHMRFGFTTELHLTRPGDITSAMAVDTDNDGSWTSFWLGSQALRYAVTGEEVALRYAWESFESYERLLSVNELDGFPSRTFERRGYKHSDKKRWRDSPDKEWEWKGHTSSDEFVSYLFVTFMMDKFIVKNESEKRRVSHFFEQVMNHLIDNDYYFVDVDGKPTKWGRWNPDYVNWYPKTIADRRTQSIELIAGFQLAYHLTGKDIYKREAYRMIDEYGYVDNILIDVFGFKETPGYIHEGADMGSGGWNHLDDHLSFMSYWILTSYAFPEFKESYKKAINNHWKAETSERNALWEMVSYATTGIFNEESVFWHLREFPLDLIRYNILNSHRKDLIFREDNFRNEYLSEPLSPLERPIHRHNTNGFRVDAKWFDQNLRELCGDEYLLPYWMARYLKVIEK